MDINTMYDLLFGNMDNLYAFALSRLGSKAAAEDLAGEIILQIIKSYASIKNDNAFFGFMWAIANNTYKKYLRRQMHIVPYDCNFMGTCYETPENILVDTEEIALLRRELSLLSEKYRDITVKYYIDGMSYKEIAAKLNISPENVRYTLFKVRKMLKEGIEMERKYGEQSYNPKIFCPDSWGNICYMTGLFKRRLPGNILFAAYDKPVTVSDISLELGVSSIYLEDELDILTKAGILKKTVDKYLTDIVILSDEFERAGNKRIRNSFKSFIDKLHHLAKNAAEAAAELDIQYISKSENRLLWLIYFEALKLTLWDCSNRCWAEVGGVPKWPDGSESLFYGHDNHFKNSRIDGIYGYWENKSKTAYTTVFNYKAFETQQNFHLNCKNTEDVNIMCDLIAGIPVDTDNLELIRLIEENVIISENDSLHPAFPVFTAAELAKLDEILQPLVKELVLLINTASDEVRILAVDYTPQHLKNQAMTVAKFNSMLAAVGIYMDMLVESGLLVLPETKTNLGIIGVIK